MKKEIRVLFLAVVDILLINLSFFLSLLVRFDFKMPQQYITIYISNMLIYIIIKLTVFKLSKLYKTLWEYASIGELIQVTTGVTMANVLIIIYWSIDGIHFPRSIYILMTFFEVVLIGGSRLSYRILRKLLNGSLSNSNDGKRIMIIGAGDAGAMVIKEFMNHTQLNSKPVAIIDDDLTKEGTRIYGVPVVGQRYDIYSTAMKMDIDEIIIAIPSASKKVIKDVVEECKKTKCKTKILPGIYELIDEKVTISKLRDVDIEDLLGREQVKLDIDSISVYLKNKVVLVTGGGGSIGSELCRQIAKYSPKKLIILDIYENNAYDIQNELNKVYNYCKDKKLDLKVLIASVRDKVRIDEIMQEYSPDVVFHAAAHKHVPLMEDNPKAAVKNNIFGTLNVAQSADKHKVKKFVLISTDKAVNPTNVMGATKRVCEMIVQSMNSISETEFVAVRFGNVLGSNGSVIPLFKKQIAQGGPITVTHPDIVRYFMTITEAAQLVLEAGAMAKGGEVFVLDMGDPVKILTLAEDLIVLSGLKPYEDIPIEVTGLRPGEKLFEELLLAGEEIASTKHEKIFIEKPIYIDYKYVLNELEKLKVALLNERDNNIRQTLIEIVPTYKDADFVNSAHLRTHEATDEIATSISLQSSALGTA